MAKVTYTANGSIQGRIAIVVSRYNDHITQKLVDGARKTLEVAGLVAEQIEVHWVPGAWELPIVVQKLAMRTDVEGVIALGAVIRGETTHDQHINRAVSQALMQISLEFETPIGFGLLTVNSLEQAIQRAGGNVGNKGEEAAKAILETIAALRQIDQSRP